MQSRHQALPFYGWYQLTYFDKLSGFLTGGMVYGHRRASSLRLRSYLGIMLHEASCNWIRVLVTNTWDDCWNIACLKLNQKSISIQWLNWIQIKTSLSPMLRLVICLWETLHGKLSSIFSNTGQSVLPYMVQCMINIWWPESDIYHFSV